MISDLSYSPETPNLGQIRRFLEPGDLEIWQMTLKNNRAPLQCYFKLCASFCSHWWIQTGVTVRKRPIWVKFGVFLEPCDLEIWRMTFKNNRAPLLCCFQLCAWFYCHMWIQTGVKSPETAKLGVDLCDLDLWPLTLSFCMDITFDHGNNSWKFHNDTMMGTWWKRCYRQTDRRTDRRTDGRTDGKYHL